jgi:nicotinate-nucleotide adenylyltransferase
MICPESQRQTRYDEVMRQPRPDLTQPMPHSAGRDGLRVAFFGGSFDPPHSGHLAVARAARDAFGLDRVLFAPVGAQPLKPEGASASFDDRLAMTRLAIEGEAGFEVSLADAPKPNGGANFTFETLYELRVQFGADCALYCLMGADSFFSLPRWHRAAEVPFVAPLIVASRPGERLNGLQAALPSGLKLEAGANQSENCSGVEVRTFRLANDAGDLAPFYVLPGLDVEISASGIRAHMRADAADTESAASVPKRVAAYIQEHDLYR